METGNCHCHTIVGAQSSKPTSKRSSTKKKSTNTAAAFKNKDEFQIHISEQLDQFVGSNKPSLNKSSTRKKKNVKIYALSDLSVSSSNNSLSESSEASDSDLPSLKMNSRMNKFTKGKTQTGTNTKAPKTTSEDIMLNNIIYETIDEAQNGHSQQPQQQQDQQQTDHSMVNSIIDLLKLISPDIVGVISSNKAPKLANNSASSSTDVNNSFFGNFFLLDNNLVKLDEPKRQLVRDVLSKTSQSSLSSSSKRTKNLNFIKLIIFLFGNFCQDQQNNGDASQNGQNFNNLLNLFFNFMEHFYEYINQQDNLPSTDTNNDTNNSEQKSTTSTTTNNNNNNIKNVTKIEETLLTQSNKATQESSSGDRSSIGTSKEFDLKEKKTGDCSNKHECELKTSPATSCIASKSNTGNGGATATTSSNQPMNVTCVNCCKPTTTSELNDFKTQISNRINTKLKHKCFEYQKEIERQNRIINDLQTKMSTEIKSRELKIVKLKNYEKLKNFYKLHNSKKGLETPTTNNNSSMNPYDDFEGQLRSSSFQVE